MVKWLLFNWILNIGNGEAGEPIDGEGTLEIPNDMLIRDSKDSFTKLLQFVYPKVENNKHRRSSLILMICFLLLS